MPTYEYRCGSCGNNTEVVQSFSDDPLTECEVCGGALRKVFAPVGIVFKGSGFYKTDNRSGRRGTVDKSGSDSSSSGSDSSSSSDSKPSSDSKAGSDSKSSSDSSSKKDSKIA